MEVELNLLGIDILTLVTEGKYLEIQSNLHFMEGLEQDIFKQLECLTYPLKMMVCVLELQCRLSSELTLVRAVKNQTINLCLIPLGKGLELIFPRVCLCLEVFA